MKWPPKIPSRSGMGLTSVRGARVSRQRFSPLTASGSYTYSRRVLENSAGRSALGRKPMRLATAILAFGLSLTLPTSVPAVSDGQYSTAEQGCTDHGFAEGPTSADH